MEIEGRDIALHVFLAAIDWLERNGIHPTLDEAIGIFVATNDGVLSATQYRAICSRLGITVI